MSLSRPILSVVVPALNEEAGIAACLSAIRREFPGEIVVVDGGSRDRTVERAEAAGARVIVAPRGLANQCNEGARLASGNVLLFLAADSRLGEGWCMETLRALQSPYVVAGGFALRLDSAHPGFRWIEWGGNYRSKYLRLALPDQGLFLRRESFEAIGGMDVDSMIPFARLCAALRTHGEFVGLRTRTTSSVRKWLTHGMWRTTLSHMATYLRFQRRELVG